LEGFNAPGPQLEIADDGAASTLKATRLAAGDATTPLSQHRGCSVGCGRIAPIGIYVPVGAALRANAAAEKDPTPAGWATSSAQWSGP